MAENTEKSEVAFEDFFTKDLHEEGVKVPLTLPDGTTTAHWVILKGKHSEAFEKAKEDGMRRIVNAMREDSDIDKSQIALEALASTVTGWSFKDKECSFSNVCELMTNAPELREAIDSFVADSTNYMKKKTTPD